MSFFKMIFSGLKFSKQEMGEVGKEEKNTFPAIILILIEVIIVSVIAYFRGNGGSSGISGLHLTGFNAAIGEFGSALIGTFLYAVILTFIMYIFKVKPSVGGIIRVWGAAVIWTIIGDLIGLLLALYLPKLAMLSLVFWLLFNIALMIGIVGYTEAKYWQSFLGIVITFMINFGIIMLYGMLLGLFFPS
ncbi:MAG: hypothetical protein ACTSWX_14955 [Promethearchaeota archaeon]